MTDRDPLDDLRAAWRALEPPAADTEDRPEDPRTRAAVEWMRGAWGTLAPPGSLARRRPAPRPVADRLRPFAAAAGLLALLGLGLTWWEARDARRADTHVAAAEAPPAAAPPVHVTSRPDGVELRRGPVRLVLLEPARAVPTPPENTSPERTSEGASNR